MAIGGGLLGAKGFEKPGLNAGEYDSGLKKMVQMVSGRPIAPEPEEADFSDVPPGYCVVNISFGQTENDMGPVPMCVADWRILVPRGSNRIISLQHLECLKDSVETEWTQPVFGEKMFPREVKCYPYELVFVHRDNSVGMDLKGIIEANEKQSVIDVTE
jgi:hypothetical protein